MRVSACRQRAGTASEHGLMEDAAKARGELHCVASALYALVRPVSGGFLIAWLLLFDSGGGATVEFRSLFLIHSGMRSLVLEPSHLPFQEEEAEGIVASFVQPCP